MRASKQGERRHLGERHCYRESGNIISVEDTEALRLQQSRQTFQSIYQKRLQLCCLGRCNRDKILSRTNNCGVGGAQ